MYVLKLLNILLCYVAEKIEEKLVASNIHNKKEFYITQLLTKAAIQIYVIYLEYDVLKNNVYCNDY